MTFGPPRSAPVLANLSRGCPARWLAQWPICRPFRCLCRPHRCLHPGQSETELGLENEQATSPAHRPVHTPPVHLFLAQLWHGGAFATHDLHAGALRLEGRAAVPTHPESTARRFGAEVPWMAHLRSRLRASVQPLHSQCPVMSPWICGMFARAPLHGLAKGIGAMLCPDAGSDRNGSGSQ